MAFNKLGKPENIVVLFNFDIYVTEASEVPSSQVLGCDNSWMMMVGISTWCNVARLLRVLTEDCVLPMLLPSALAL